MATKYPTEAERFKQVMEIAEQVYQFGSMAQHLSPEVLKRPRDCGELAKAVAVRAEKSELPTPEQDRLMDTVYGLPPSRF